MVNENANRRAQKVHRSIYLFDVFLYAAAGNGGTFDWMEIGDSSHVDMNNCNCGVPLHNELVGRNTKNLLGSYLELE